MNPLTDVSSVVAIIGGSLAIAAGIRSWNHASRAEKAAAAAENIKAEIDGAHKVAILIAANRIAVGVESLEKKK
jgi:predicted DNA-binding transcriptional regulator YafY